MLLLLQSCTSTSPGSPDAQAGVDASSRDADPAPDIRPLDPPCAATDLDGDGFGTDPSCPQIDCDDHNLNIHPGAPEACNGVDDDCNGTVDENLGEGTCGVGACMRTAPFCVAGHPARCEPGMGGPETCNGIDDDCNGMVDDGVVGPSCGSGACARTAACMNGQFEACTPGAPGMETCNRIDDNCDGTVDEGFRVEVVNGSYAALYSLHPSCDGTGERIGPNCNAAMHRFCAARGCNTSGFGPLENSGDVAVIGCVSAEPAIDVPFAELNQAAAGCDGATERFGLACNSAIHRTCRGRGFETGFGPVEQSATSAVVVCLRAGAVSVVQTAYSVLSTFHADCNATARGGPACNAAINRFCRGQGQATGFGPLENNGDVAVVACVQP